MTLAAPVQCPAEASLAVARQSTSTPPGNASFARVTVPSAAPALHAKNIKIPLWLWVKRKTPIYRDHRFWLADHLTMVFLGTLL